MTFTFITALAGLVFGLIGSTLGYLNYRRDRPKVIVKLDFHYDLTELTGKILLEEEEDVGHIYIANAGRRAVYITYVGLAMFLVKVKAGLLNSGDVPSEGFKLGEGDPPAIIRIPQRSAWLNMYAEYWREIRAIVVDSGGRYYFSKPLKRRPRWGIGDGKLSWKQIRNFPESLGPTVYYNKETGMGVTKVTLHPMVKINQDGTEEQITPLLFGPVKPARDEGTGSKTAKKKSGKK